MNASHRRPIRFIDLKAENMKDSDPGARQRNPASKWSINQLWEQALDADADCDPALLESVLRRARRAGVQEVWVTNPIGQALWNDKPRAALTLIGLGESFLERDPFGTTLLCLAARFNSGEVVAALLAKGVPPDERSLNRLTALHQACSSSDVSVVRLLLVAGADVHARDRQGRTPLHRACQSENPPICIALLEGGADLQALDNKQQTPMESLFSECRDPKASDHLQGVLDSFVGARNAMRAIEEVLAASAKAMPLEIGKGSHR